MRKIYLLRHCETEHFLKKRCIGITDVDLSENGIRQAQSLKKYFKDKTLNGIFCSDALRAVKTSEIISDGKIPITKLSGLHEINMGDWEGMYFDEIKAKFPDEYRRRGLDFAEFSPPNGESFAACQKRAAEVFQDILINSDGDITIVSHAGFNRALICSLCRIDLQKLFTIPQPFGCLNLLSLQNGVCSVWKIGDNASCEIRTGAVIVAAGMSSRMKAFKPMLKLRNSTIIKTVISSLRSTGVGEIVVVTGNNAKMLTEHLSPIGVTCLYNEKYKTTEMFDSAKIGLNYLKGRCDRIFFLPGDVPLFSRHSLKSMTDDMDRGGCEILLPVHDGKAGHPILIDSGAVPFLVDYTGSGGLKGAIDRFGGPKRTISLDDAGMTLDADRPEDYERLKEYAGRQQDDTDETDV